MGLHTVKKALANGHNVTLFNRGETNPDIFPELEKLTGDRDGKLDALKGRKWDCVVDTCGYFPRIVKQSAELLKDAVGQYIFISTISVYNEEGVETLDEGSELLTIEDETIEEINGETYGPLKVLCEKAIVDVYKDRALIIRPGLIIGPDDPTDRFTHWPRRMSEGGKVLCPDLPDQPTQFIDVRDLADFTIKMAEKKAAGIYNATGPDYEILLNDFFTTCHKLCGEKADLIWVADKFLQKQDVAPYMDIPLWVSGDTKPYTIMRTDCRRAISQGLKFRPLEETIGDTMAWHKTRPEEIDYRCGLKPDKEKEIIAKWEVKKDK